MIAAVAAELYGCAPTDVRIEHERIGRPARQATRVGDLALDSGSVVAIRQIQRGYLGEHHFFTDETCYYLGAANAFHGDELPFGGFRGTTSYTVHIEGDPADSTAQWEFDATADPDPIVNGQAYLILDAIGPVCAAEPGILIEDPRPRYQHDYRVHPMK